MRLRAVLDSDYERRRNDLIPKCEKIAYERTKDMGYNTVQRAAYSRAFMTAMQDEAVRIHLTDGMEVDSLVLLARQLKIQVTPPSELIKGIEIVSGNNHETR